MINTKTMKLYRYILILSLLAVPAALRAQEPGEPTALRDSIVYRLVSQVDSSLVGISIFDILPSKDKGDASDVILSQGDHLPSVMENYIARNREKTLNGFRVRIFFDNKQNSRTAAQDALEAFNKVFRGIPSYLSYQSPFFKVTVGDFRTKSEAMELLRSLKGMFPAAFIVKEGINYPIADKDNTYIVDTLKVL